MVTTTLAPEGSCEECRFSAADHSDEDLIGTLGAIPAMAESMIEGTREDVLARRPPTGGESPLEHLLAAAHAVQYLGHGDNGSPPAATTSAKALIHLASTVRSALAEERARDREWTDGDRRALQEVVHDTTHRLKSLGRALHALGAGVPSHEGSVLQINLSDGGVPKTPVPAAEVSQRGLVGDRQANRRHHGRPLQALCLWSGEVIDALRVEGHPIAPGLAGENLTLGGLDWAALRPGARLLIGDVSVELSAWATPCSKNADWFYGGDFNRMAHDRHPGWSRAYAWVLEGGTVAVGDPVVVEP